MALWERLFHEDGEVSIGRHAFSAAVKQYARGNGTAAQFKTFFNIQAGSETTQIDALFAEVDAAADGLDYAHLVEDVLELSEAGAYDKAAAQSQLGL